MDSFLTFWRELTLPQAVVITAVGYGIVCAGKSFLNSGRGSPENRGEACVDNRKGRIDGDVNNHNGDSANPTLSQIGYKSEGSARFERDLNINMTASQRNDARQRTGNRHNSNFGHTNRIDERQLGESGNNGE